MSKLFLAGLIIALYAIRVDAQQVSDTHFNHPIPDPMYRVGSGPLILFDEAHNNVSTLRGAYAAFGKLLRSDGYTLMSTKDAVSHEMLKDAKIYVTVNAMYDLEDWDLPARSAFTEQEVNALASWVENGGSLFLVTDHMPCGASVNELAGKFGVNVINGFALRKDGQPEIFSKANGNLYSNVMTGTPGKEVDQIRCWGGTGFIVPPAAHVISVLGEDYTIYLPSEVAQLKHPMPEVVPHLSGRGIVNGAYLTHGKGKVVIFGDGAPFSAQLHGIKSEKRGMNHPTAAHNAQFLLNIIHWLDDQL